MGLFQRREDGKHGQSCLCILRGAWTLVSVYFTGSIDTLVCVEERRGSVNSCLYAANLLNLLNLL